MVTAAPGPVVKGAVPFFITLIRSPMSWVFSAIAHYHQSVEGIVKADARSLNIGHSGQSPENWRRAKWYGFDFPLIQFSGSGVPVDQRVAVALHNLRDSAFGLVSDFSASLVVILWQLGIPKQAELFCSSLTPASSRYKSNSSYNLDIQFYSTVSYMMAKMQPYECVYTNAASVFYQRLRMAQQDVCKRSR